MFDVLKGNQGTLWTIQFNNAECTTDSDGDTRTNGEELGINCDTMETLPDFTIADVTHPGTL